MESTIKLQQYLSTNPHPTILFGTDLEPDDFGAIMLLIAELRKQEKPVQLTFLVGEGHSGIKVLRMQRLIELMRQENLLGENITTTVIQGYGSGKTFSLDGLELYPSEQAVQEALAQAELGDGLSAAEQENTLEQLSSIFRDQPETFVISIKPPRELVDLCHRPEPLMQQATYWGTFSFNVRTLISEVEDQAKKSAAEVKPAVMKRQAEITHCLQAFKNMFYFESFFTVGEKNSFNEKHSPNLFYRLQDTLLGKIFVQLIKKLEYKPFR